LPLTRYFLDFDKRGGFLQDVAFCITRLRHSFSSLRLIHVIYLDKSLLSAVYSFYNPFESRSLST
jgi:arginyl-tRNA--protein-N-Asp/Glu arginylyltransferase